MSKVGTMVIGDKALPLSRVSLYNGRINFIVEGSAPIDLPHRSEVRVYGADGSLVLTAPWHLSEKECRQLRRSRCESYMVEFPFAVASVADKTTPDPCVTPTSAVY